MRTGRSSGGRSARSSPSSRMLPPSGRSKPAIIRSSVVLPQPEGPSSVKNSPASIAEAHAVDGGEVAEAARHVPDLEERHRRALRRIEVCAGLYSERAAGGEPVALRVNAIAASVHAAPGEQCDHDREEQRDDREPAGCARAARPRAASIAVVRRRGGAGSRWWMRRGSSGSARDDVRRLGEQPALAARGRPIRSSIQRSRKGIAVTHRSRSGSSCRPRPSTLSSVFCSSTSCGWISMLKRRDARKSCSSTRAERDLRQRPVERRLAARRGSRPPARPSRVSAGTQPDSRCAVATRW